MLIYPYINQLKFLQKIGKQQIDKDFPVFINYFSLNCPRYGAQINAFIDILDIKYYWYILYPIIKEINSEVLSEYDNYLYNEIKNSLL